MNCRFIPSDNIQVSCILDTNMSMLGDDAVHMEVEGDFSGENNVTATKEVDRKLSLLGMLPCDAMNVILSFLTLDDFEQLSAVSKRMNEAVSFSSHLNMSGSTFLSVLHSTRKRLVPSTKIPQDDLRQLLERFKNLNIVHLQGLASVGDDLVSIINEYSAASSLTTISLHGCSLSYWCAQSFQLKHLQHVALSSCSIRVPIYSLLKHSPKLKSLSIAQCSALKDDDLFDIQLLLHKSLQSLTLKQCIRINRPVLQFPSLSRLNMVGCFGLASLNGFLCPNLRYLNLSFCMRLTGEQIEQLVARIPNLEELVMMKCSGVCSFTLSSRHLQSLNVSFCHNLRELRMDCPSLRELEVSHIFVEGVESVSRLFANFRVLLQSLIVIQNDRIYPVLLLLPWSY